MTSTLNNNSDYLIMENLVDYDRIYLDIYLYIDVYNAGSTNNNKFHDKFGNLNVKVRNNITNNNHYYKTNKSYYFILDTSTAFAHWIYESFIFISELIELNKTNNNIKILTKNNKKYVKSFLKFFNINNEIVNTIDNYNNITYSPLFMSLNFTHKNPKNDNYFNYHLDYYIDYIKNNIINIPSINKCVFLPRNDLENFVEIKINNKDKIKEIIINNGGIVLDTYHLNNIKYQFSILNNSDTIIIDFGSSFLVNCIFLKNKKIYLLINNYNNYHAQMRNNPYINYFVQTRILNNNYVKLIYPHQLDLIENISKPTIE